MTIEMLRIATDAAIGIGLVVSLSVHGLVWQRLRRLKVDAEPIRLMVAELNAASDHCNDSTARLLAAQISTEAILTLSSRCETSLAELREVVAVANSVADRIDMACAAAHLARRDLELCKS
ncbi:hypothetical protein [Sandaracinobacteroides saxicola]|uniref:Uncharacterized protein n=1 Tax=Sandaracinobacteroides saxicola TaxID=2759707 RepID=A0A7G5IK20_9SPHN|nr:hypothetical protein [Sandaracinobacteroides saxicola]QMW23712.1 hypothetical protein H3309_04280 [Sandaracinobacteroides saxicola]